MLRGWHPALLLLIGSAGAAFGQMMQEDLMRPGEAYLTRFSGTIEQAGPGGQTSTVINLQGTVGSIIDIRSPQRPPRGEHWYNEPQRKPVTAVEVGQVFGVVLDDATPPNIFLSATSAFGLHLAPGTRQWMPGQWGAGGGPGTIYRLTRDSGYRPSIFAQVTLNGRQNTGAALGNMAFDRVHKTLYASDLETGMIHAFRAADGADMGFYDHGTIGRARFFDAENNTAGNLSAITFDPRSAVRIADCPSGPFEQSTECWNFAATGRRVWGLGVRHDVTKNETRLYYAVWSGPAFGNEAAWNAASDDDKRNSIWSVRLGANGSFDVADIRREFLLPDFFIQPNDVTRAGFSQPVSDITFSDCGERPVMLIAERGGIRNLGLAAENPFAFPHEARALRYELDTAGVWRPIGRYDVGYYDRKDNGQPYMRANCAGGIAFGSGYTSDWTVDLTKLDQFVWMTGDSLCSPEGPCHLFGTAEATANVDAPQNVAAQINEDADDSQVHGAQGQPENLFQELMPAASLAPYPAGEASPYPPTGPDQSYLIDADINVDANGNLIEAELARNDATKIGDIAIYEICLPRQQFAFLQPPEPGAAPPVLIGHDEARSHFLVASHQVRMSHYRFGSHNLYWSHNRFRSHHTYWSHSRSGSHNPRWSHSRRGSHHASMSHSRRGSHHTYMSHGRPPGTGHPPPTTNHGKPPTGGNPPPTTNHGKPPPGTGTVNKGGPGPTTSTNQGAPPGGTVTMNSGSCTTVAGRTTCTSGGGYTCTTTASFCQPQPPTHANVQQPGVGTAAINRQNAGKPQGGALPTHKGTTTSHQGTTTSHQGTTTSHQGTTTSHQGTTTSHQGTTTSHQGTTTSHKGTTTSHKGTTTSHKGTTTSHRHTRTASHSHGSRSRSGSQRVSHKGSSTRMSHVNRGNVSRSGGSSGRGRHSDIRLKEDVTLLQRLNNGIGIYRFRYKGNDRTFYVGVVAQEVQRVVPSAVRRGSDGYLLVSYERLGLDFLTWDAWQRSGPR
jgi:hypothetical protein